MEQEIVSGMPVSSGIAHGNAIVIESSKNFDKLKGLEGVILVVKNFDPNYDILLPKCKGIVSEIGNLLCHLAIVARIREIPAIVNCLNATTTIKDGDPLKINAYTGKVYKTKTLEPNIEQKAPDLFESFKKIVLED
jgi:pyruvate,water dikinase